MSGNSAEEKPFSFEFTGDGEQVLLELRNETDQTLKCIEVLTVFLKDEDTPGGGPSQVNIKFKTTPCMHPKEKVVLSHITWINGKPAEAAQNQLERLKVIAGVLKPYVLDISWENPEGKTRFQRIPVGH
jgi:hypothetical protein